MSERNSRVAEALAAAGVEPAIRILEADAKTAAAAAEHLGCAETIGKASPRKIREATGQVIGGVAPVGHPSRLRTVVDGSLARRAVIWSAAGTATR